jgi:putative ATP-dependent endonuclease of OLD family
VVLPRFLRAHGLAEDMASIVVAPLGGRHVSHFWRLLHGLDIPFVTLLDLDLGRYQGGWGRVRVAAEQLLRLGSEDEGLSNKAIDTLPGWDSSDDLLTSKLGREWLPLLEKRGVFFSIPLDLDFAMLNNFPAAYDFDEDFDAEDPDSETLKAVFHKAGKGLLQFPASAKKYLTGYRARFKVGSKPARHIAAMAEIDDPTAVAKTPKVIARLIAGIRLRLAAIPE